MMMSMMPHQTTPVDNHALATSENREEISTRFGPVTIDRRNALIFPKGLLGMPQNQRFALAPFPNENMRAFQLMQSLEDPTLAFIMLPLTPENSILRPEHVSSACRDLALREEDVLVLLVVCVHREGAVSRVSVNARAPVLIDVRSKRGVQFVFTQDQYKVQHYIT